MDPNLMRLYEAELSYLREMGAEFADEFPKVAGRLDLANTEVADPFVERMLEGFAFLTARIQLKMESEFPTFTQSLLQMVYPHFAAPTPSMVIAKVTPSDALVSNPAGVVLPRGSELRSLLGTEDQTNCVFRTAHPIHLLPVTVAEAEYVGAGAAVAALGVPDSGAAKAAIRLRLRSMGGMPIGKIALDRLTFYLGGPEVARMRLYEQLSAQVLSIVVRPTTRPIPWQERLRPASLVPVGFEPDEALLPALPQTFDGYRLLQEYYALPERFLFFSLTDLDRAAIQCTGAEMDVIILLDHSEPTLASLTPDHLLLNCAPAVNLFPKRADRVNLDSTRDEHLVVPDRMRPLDYEVFSIGAMEGFPADGGPTQPFLPFYAANDLSRNPGHRSYYMQRRQPHLLSSRARQRGPRSSYVGHDVFVSLVDADNQRAPHSMRQLGVDLMCTNRDLALSMPVGKQHTDFTVVVNAPIASVRCLVGPTAPRPCRPDGDLAWRFISHLGLNYLTLTDTDALQGAAALRELLRLYVPPNNTRTARQLEGLLSVKAEPVVRRIPGAGPVCAGRGLQVRLSIDDTPFGGAGGILFAAVLDRFFGKYVSINAFIETVMSTPDRGQVMRWPIRLGRRPIT